MKNILFLILLFLFIKAQSQTNVIETALSYLEMNTNARIGALGDVGCVASSFYNDAGSYQNPSLLASKRSISGINFSYDSWETIIPFKFYNATAYFSIDSINSFSYSFTDADFGKFKFYTRDNLQLSNLHAYGLFHQLSYARILSKSFAAGVAVKYIFDHLAEEGDSASPIKSYAIDFGINYAKAYKISHPLILRMNIGSAITNFGPKVTYFKSNNGKDFIPTTLKAGLLLNPEISFDQNVKLNIESYYQVQKFLVPTPPLYDNNGVVIKGKNPDVSIFKALYQSFYDAPGGFKEEMREIEQRVGGEVRLGFKNEIYIAARMGRFIEHETKGNRHYTTVGYGIGIYGFCIDYRYLHQDEMYYSTWALTIGFKSDLNNLFHF